MSARSPRRTFAASFVVTLAAAPACMTAPPPPRPNPPGPTEAAPVERDHRDEAAPVERDHRDEATPVERDHRQEAGRPNENPPPPTPPPIATPQPVDAAPTSERRWVLEMTNGKCSTRANASCPKPQPGKPMMTCNPPGPREYACLPGMANGASLVIVQGAGAKDCFIPPPPINCPKGAMCNPPPPRQVTCPQ